MKIKKTKKIIGGIFRVLGVVMITIITLSLITAVAMFIRYRDTLSLNNDRAKTIVSNSTENTFKQRGATNIFDKNGELLTEIKIRDYEYVDYEHISQQAKDVFISAEDRRFYEHKGIDVKGLSRAGLAYVRNRGEITQGGSTITQQLVKNVFLSHEQTASRKLQEIFIAYRLEQKYSKQDIMEFYLNNIYFGRGVYGIQTASQFYFDKDASELTIEEGVVLAALTNNPTVFDPIDNKETAKGRHHRIFYMMLENEKISESEYNRLINSDIEVTISDDSESEQINENLLDTQDFVSTYVIHNATEEIMKKNGFVMRYLFSTEDAENTYKKNYNEMYKRVREQVMSGGYNIYTTIDMEKQRELQRTIDNELSRYSNEELENGIFALQSSVATIDNNTGEIVAVVGGRTGSSSQNVFNRSFQGARQPGSATKPILVYAPSFDLGYIPQMRVKDEPINNGPSNYDNRYRGYVTISDAIKYSYNTIPYKIMEDLGGDVLMSKLGDMEFSHLSYWDKNPITSVGGFHNGTTSPEMASAFATLANEGRYRTANGIYKIEDLTGETIYSRPSGRGKQIYSKGSAYITTQELMRVTNERGGTAYGTTVNGFESAGKTGTTSNYRDSWFVGYTPEYTTSVWVGYDIPRTLNRNERNIAKNLWKIYMNAIHNNELEKREFEINDEVIEMYLNPSSYEVSTEKRGGWVSTLLPTSYINKINSDMLERQERLEKERRERELAEKRERERLDRVFREEVAKDIKGSGKALSKELKDQETAKNMFSELERFRVTDEYTFNRGITLKDNVEKFISDNVEYEKLRLELLIKTNREGNRITNEINTIRRNLELEKERLEKERLEEERKLEEKRLEEKRLEEKRLEEERLEKERLEEDNNNTENNTEDENNSEREDVKEEDKEE